MESYLHEDVASFFITWEAKIWLLSTVFPTTAKDGEINLGDSSSLVEARLAS